AEILPSERKHDCVAFLRRAVAWYADRGITIERVITDNAKAYHSHAWRDTCAYLEIGRRYTRPYSPWTNGKAEALIKTLLREWAYRFAYPTSTHRARAAVAPRSPTARAPRQPRNRPPQPARTP